MPSVSMMARSVATRRVESVLVEAVAAEFARAAEDGDTVGALAEGLEDDVLADAADAGGQHAHRVALAAPAAAIQALEREVRRPLAREDHDPRRGHGRSPAKAAARASRTWRCPARGASGAPVGQTARQRPQSVQAPGSTHASGMPEARGCSAIASWGQFLTQVPQPRQRAASISAAVTTHPGSGSGAGRSSRRAGARRRPAGPRRHGPFPAPGPRRPRRRRERGRCRR